MVAIAKHKKYITSSHEGRLDCWARPLGVQWFDISCSTGNMRTRHWSSWQYTILHRSLINLDVIWRGTCWWKCSQNSHSGGTYIRLKYDKAYMSTKRMLGTKVIESYYTCTFRISGIFPFGPLEEKGATTGASQSPMTSLFKIFAWGFLWNKWYQAN